MELRNTIDLMNSADYKERFKAEYWQTRIRYDKLHKMIIKYEAGTLNFTPVCSLELLKEQKSAMGKYLYCLEVRAEIEGVDILTVLPDSEDMESLKCNSDSLKVEIMENRSSLKYAVEDFLTDCGISSSISGYKFLTTSICLLLEHPEYEASVTKLLYPEVARIHNSTQHRVERAIRHAIESAFDEVDASIVRKVFGNSVPRGGKPTNTQFIYRVVQIIQRKIEVGNNAT